MGRKHQPAQRHKRPTYKSKDRLPRCVRKNRSLVKQTRGASRSWSERACHVQSARKQSRITPFKHPPLRSGPAPAQARSHDSLNAAQQRDRKTALKRSNDKTALDRAQAAFHTAIGFTAPQPTTSSCKRSTDST